MFTDKIMLALYQAAIDKIDDHFEYRYDSALDRAIVLGIIDRLRRKLEDTCNEDEE